ncbi:alpha/beta hydrolase [Streptococcus halichoeri]|uniref:alpha/beta hydrolase n=1 Tax=Streptococcus halichoeri TaxID=254785 RepID=UPI00135895F9|nr:alpha/beta hydrolase [Streptococcus halichoeri]
MHYLYQAGSIRQRLLVLLHGTGGDENSLLPLAKQLDPTASILAIRGQVSENGALRYFKRLAHGHYDLADLQQRGQALRQFILSFAQQHDFKTEQIILVGFSNGANIAINMLLADRSSLKKAILFAPMYPVDTRSLTESKADTMVFISTGTQDPIVTTTASQEVLDLFTSRQAQVTSFQVRGHEITLESLEAAKVWLEKQ